MILLKIKKKNIALETLEIYSPLAERLGMQDIRAELDDLSFKVLEPEIRESIIHRLELLRQQDKKFTRQNYSKNSRIIN